MQTSSIFLGFVWNHIYKTGWYNRIGIRTLRAICCILFQNVSWYRINRRFAWPDISTSPLKLHW